MRIACTVAPGKGDTDLLLERLARRLAARGLRLCGTVQTNTECADGLCDMDVQVLPDGPVLRISQSLGAGARGCRLDPAALETAVGLVGARLRGGADLLMINKFGKQEAEGHGFRDVIAEALAMEVPVLVGLNGLNQDAFDAFAQGLAERLAPDPDALEAWALSAVPGMVPAK